MSPAAHDPDWFQAQHGCRPVEWLAAQGLLGPDAVIAHMVLCSEAEAALLGRSQTNVVLCPTTALKVGYGLSQTGLFPEMADAGATIALGTDGNNGANYSDLMRATYLAAGLFNDARRKPAVFPAETALDMTTRNGARALQLQDQIGSLEIGKKADLVLHDTDRPEWRPLLNVANQLVWSADGRGVHSVFVDGEAVVENYRATKLDEERLLAQAQQTAEAIVARSGLATPPKWPWH